MSHDSVYRGAVNVVIKPECCCQDCLLGGLQVFGFKASFSHES